jgi:hypothetical protein
MKAVPTNDIVWKSKMALGALLLKACFAFSKSRFHLKPNN